MNKMLTFLTILLLSLISIMTAQGQPTNGADGVEALANFVKIDKNDCPIIDNVEVDEEGLLSWKIKHQISTSYNILYQFAKGEPQRVSGKNNSAQLMGNASDGYVYVIIVATCKSGSETYYLYTNDPDAKISHIQVVNIESIELYCCEVCVEEGCHCNDAYCSLLPLISNIKKNKTTDTKGQLPLDMSFSQPNPFQDNTLITYQLDSQAQVNLYIYNAEGKKVATLINKKSQAQGEYQVNWNATSLPKGIYYYTINVGGKQQTQKLIKLK